MTEREQFLSDVIVTAVEAGYEWWLVKQYQYSYDGKTVLFVGERTGEGTRAILRELDERPTGYKEEDLLLDYAAVERGIHRFLSYEAEIGPRFRARLREADRENDASNIDAADADAIVQVALLEETVYG